MRFLAAALLFAAASTAAQAADWRVATAASQAPSGRAIGFIDAEAIVRTGDRVTFWAFLIYERKRNGFDNEIVHFAADCSTHGFESDSVSSYRGERRVGTSDVTERGRAAPNSVGFGLIEVACGAARLDPANVRDPYGFVRRNARRIWVR